VPHFAAHFPIAKGIYNANISIVNR
jgi:hypothetical protein